MTYLTTLLDSSFKKEEFSCGKSMLDDYLHQQASQDMKRKLCVVFVLSHEKTTIKGYYTLSNDSIPRELVPDEIMNKMPKSYKNLPTTLLGRLAVDKKFMKLGLGELLLLDALKRSYDISKTSVGSMAVVVDPLDNDAVDFYSKYGFTKLPDSGRMFLSMKKISRLSEP
jgi:predicted GNAT family N-acyltransferase